MGWFENKAKQTLGDAPLDVLRRAFLEVAAEYREALERPPTLEEVQELLRVVLSGADASMIQDLEKRNVSAVKLTTKAQPKKQEWDTGDSFALPLPDGTYGFGRVLFRVPPKKGKGIVEIFRIRSDGPIPRAGFKDAGRLFSPVAVNGVFGFESGRWRILEHDPAFRAPDHDEVRLFSPGRNTAQIFNIEYKTVDRDVPLDKLPKGATETHKFLNSSDKNDLLAKEVLRQLDEAGVRAS